ncbi:MAG: DUF86 domain-containing protein [candidate division NC10 bacterium]|nr:DUF86 domain-containing protein [candidate division NC10 bacterium]
MSRHDPFVRLHHMLDYAREAVAMAQGKTATELSENRQMGLALTHLVELIGEAASQVPREVQARYPHTPWSKIISMRNRLIHGYDYVDHDILWDTITHDLPPLIAELEKIIPPEES